MFIDENDFDSLLEIRSETVQMRVSVLGEMIAPNDSAVSRSRNERIGIGSEFAIIGVDELAEDGDSSFEWNDKGNCR